MPIPLTQGSGASTCLCFALIGAALCAAPAPARAQAAQPGLALSRFDPAPAGDRMFGVPSPYAAGHLTPHVMLLADYAHNPLVVRREGTSDVVGAVVSSQLILHLDATLALWNRVAVDVDLPLALVQTGDDPGAAGQAFPSARTCGSPQARAARM